MYAINAVSHSINLSNYINDCRRGLSTVIIFYMLLVSTETVESFFNNKD